MKVHFGPNICQNIKSLLYYASRTVSTDLDHTVHSYDEDDHTLFTFVQTGTFTVNNVIVHIEKSPEVYTLGERGLVSSFNGYIESSDIAHIEQLFETAVEYTKNLVNENKNKDSIKILNFDYRWECDTIIKKKTFAAIHLPSKVLGDFRSDMENFMSEENRKRFAELEIVPCRIYALYGPPGTGKTTLIHTIASHYSMNLATLTFDNAMSDKVLRMAMKKMPTNTILYLEDIDCLFQEDRKSSESFLTFSGLLNALDGLCKVKNTIIFMTTNHLNRLDPALKRRIDYFVKFDFCTKEQVQDMFARFLPNESFDLFWGQCAKMRLTPSILQKFFMCNMHKKFEDYYKTIGDFVQSEHGLEKTLDMYT
jgi:hypothetical protein